MLQNGINTTTNPVETLKALQRARANTQTRFVQLASCRNCDPKLAEDQQASIVVLDKFIADIEAQL